jgi:hypothetical protein
MNNCGRGKDEKVEETREKIHLIKVRKRKNRGEMKKGGGKIKD